MGQNGYIRLYRKLKENPIYTNSKAVHVWVECLMRATYKEREVYKGREKIRLEPGQFLMGRAEFGNSVNMSGSTAWYWLQEMEADNMIDIKSTTKGSIVTVLNWEEYQQVDNTSNSKKTAKKQQKNTNNKVKKVNKVNNKDNKEKPNPSELYNDFAPVNGNGLKYDKIKDRWNQAVPEPLQIRNMTQKRKEKLRNRYKEDGFSLQEIVDAIQEQPFLMGQNDRGWTVDFTWLIKNQENWTKVVERSYKDNKTTSEETQLKKLMVDAAEQDRQEANDETPRID